ncbi:MAG: hypothetical protein EXR75_12780 [Myxococcales bacterium]|nr:hypothetical protein [Myxococcales bacterium]
MASRTGLALVLLTLGVGFTAEANATETLAPAAPAADALAPAAPAADALAPAAPATAPLVSATDVGLPARVPWRGTSLSWGHSATASLLGVGDDFQSSDFHAYSMNWTLALNYFVIDEEKWKLSVSTVPALSVELTNSDTTTTYRELQFADLPVLAAYSRKLVSSGLWSTGTSLTTALIFPTSKTSAANGTYVTTSPRLGLTQNIPLFGEDSSFLKSVGLGANLRWDHRFARALTATQDGFERPRQTANGDTFLSDQLSFSRLSLNTVREALSLSFSEAVAGMPLSMDFNFTFAQSVLPHFSESACAVEILTGCVPVGASADSQEKRYTWGFGAELGFQPVPEMSFSVGYANVTATLGPDGTRRAPFAGPDAEFSASLSFAPDALFERLTGPKRELGKAGDKKRRF